ncbi:MAG TPA: hypothetical protein VGM78_04785 [Ilumatobacteraceae bacterium]
MGAVVTGWAGAGRRLVDRTIRPRFADPLWRRQACWVLGVLGLLAFMIRVLGASWPGHFKIFFPDSFSFKNAAKLTPFNPKFYAAERPIAYPALLFVLGRSTVVTVVVQTALYGLAYLVAARAAFRILRRNEARVVCVFLVLTIAIEPRFALWNTHILSESLGMTLAVLSVVGWWLFAAEPSRRRLNWAGLATIAWLTVRDSNVPPWAAVGVPALLLASWLWKGADPLLRRSLRRWGIITLAVCIGVAVTQAANGRDRYATLNNVGQRVLPDAQITSWFADHGMPLDAALLKRKGASSFDNNWDMLTSPDLATFRAWADGSGQRLMLLSYVRFAPHWISVLNHDLPVLLSSNQSAYDAFGVSKRLPDPPPAQIAGPTSREGLVVWTVLSVAALAIAFTRRRRVQAVVLALLLVSTFVDLYMAYIGDSVEVQRHMVGPLSRMALVMVLCLAVGFDAMVELVSERWHASRAEERVPDATAADPNDDSDELVGALDPAP